MTSLVGLICGFAVVILGSMLDGDPVSSLYSPTAFVIVILGTCTAVTTQFGLFSVLRAFKALLWIAKYPGPDLNKFVEQLGDWASVSRSQSVLALEEVMDAVPNALHKKALQLIVDNSAPEDLRATLQVIAEDTARIEHIPGEVWEAAGGYAPTIGVMGAVLGLIHVMMMLNHPELLGEGIATAFVATIYGVGGANLIFLPLGGNLIQTADRLERERHVIIEGLVLLCEQRSGSAIRQNLEHFLGLQGGKKKPESAPDDEQAEELETA